MVVSTEGDGWAKATVIGVGSSSDGGGCVRIRTGIETPGNALSNGVSGASFDGRCDGDCDAACLLMRAACLAGARRAARRAGQRSL